VCRWSGVQLCSAARDASVQMDQFPRSELLFSRRCSQGHGASNAASPVGGGEAAVSRRLTATVLCRAAG
jgi:hypothetical protein